MTTPGDSKSDELRLPAAVIQRLIKSAVPDGTIVSKETKTAIARATAVFILHTTNFANEAAINANRKTINAQDVLQGLTDLDCEQLVEPVKESLAQWKEEQRAKKAAKKPRLSETAASNQQQPDDTNEDDESTGPPTAAEDDGHVQNVDADSPSSEQPSENTEDTPQD